MKFDEKTWEETFQGAFSVLQNDFKELRQELYLEKEKSRHISELIAEGVFFLNPSFYIQSRYTKALEVIIDETNLDQKNFIDLLINRVPENVIRQTEEYLDFMFRPDLDEETINELNQLSNIEFYYKDQWGFWTTSKFLSFTFKRMYEDENIISLIVSVRDITKEEKLSHQLDEFEKNTKKQMERLVNVLHVKPSLLHEFIELINRELEVINRLLKTPDSKDNYQKMMSSLLRSTRYILNNALLLDLKFFSNNAQDFLNEIQKIKAKENINGSDFVPLVLKFSQLRETIEEIQELTQRLEHFSNNIRTTRRYEAKLLMHSLEQMVHRLCTESNKKIRLVYDKFDSLSIPYEHQQLVKELLFSFTRFTILYHSETPEARRSSNMSPEVTIEVESSITKRNFGFVFRHNGRLQRLERIVQNAIENHAKQTGPEYDIERTSQIGSEISRLFFTPSHLINEVYNEDDDNEALVNMELVKKKLTMHGGRMKIIFTSELSTEYHITIPQKSIS